MAELTEHDIREREATRADMVQWTGRIAGALTPTEFRHALADAGLVDVEIEDTHRVHEHAAAAIIRGPQAAGARMRRLLPSGLLPGVAGHEHVWV